ncbi:MAG TPA: hypothetical protein VJY35_14885 [Candidatus Eisenbacteria bacterium]|nr:hypothetical protein [Candidatus Eisenbacteria bacterium]
MKITLRCLFVTMLLASFPVSRAAADDQPPYLRDRGPGIRTSMFGSYIQPRELLIYTFYEYYKDNNQQYSPDEYGVAGTQDFEGRFRANEGIIFLGYGISDRLMIEMEAAVISATFEKDPADNTATPAKIEESGLGDVEGQIAYRWLKEDETRPEVFSFLEVVGPHDKEKVLIGTSDWELKFGSGVSRGFQFGTLSARAAVEYIRASETPWDFGEWGLEYLRRVNPDWRVYFGFEGQGTDELSAIGEIQRRLGSNATLKVGTGIGVTSNTTDFAPELGIMFSLPTGR